MNQIWFVSIAPTAPTPARRNGIGAASFSFAPSANTFSKSAERSARRIRRQLHAGDHNIHFRILRLRFVIITLRFVFNEAAGIPRKPSSLQARLPAHRPYAGAASQFGAAHRRWYRHSLPRSPFRMAAGSANFLGNQRRKRFFRANAKTGRYAVAEKHDGFFPGRRGRSWRLIERRQRYQTDRLRTFPMRIVLISRKQGELPIQ